MLRDLLYPTLCRLFKLKSTASVLTASLFLPLNVYSAENCVDYESFPGKSYTQTLFSATSDAIPGITSKLELNLGDGFEIRDMIVINDQNPPFCTHSSYETLNQKKELLVYGDRFPVVGIVKVIKLNVGNFDSSRGGDVSLDFLSNALKGKRKQVRLTLKNNKGEWEAYSGSTKVDSMCFKRRKLGKVVVGIKEILINEEC